MEVAVPTLVSPDLRAGAIRIGWLLWAIIAVSRYDLGLAALESAKSLHEEEVAV